MSRRATAFVVAWADNVVQATELATTEMGASDLARRCIVAALHDGIAPEEIEVEFPNLTDFFASALQAAADRQGKDRAFDDP
ncbi:MAG: DUF768 domain-containing protein [Hyphomicrobiales bacterium]|nr:MAG: DUF768 domain-containing protein [Hyphomicrobiales bacterium]